MGLRPSPDLHDLDRALLRDLRPAGVILYKSNFRHDLPYDAWLESHARLISEIAPRPDAPHVHRHRSRGRAGLPDPTADHAILLCRAMGEGCRRSRPGDGARTRSLGVNLNFAPVLDIDTNPDNPVIGERAFGRTAEAVIAAALPFMHAMQAENVIACGKHFPGHGDTSVDSHSACLRKA